MGPHGVSIPAVMPVRRSPQRKPDRMPSLDELPEDELKIARDAAETVICFRTYLPTGLFMVMLSKFRDDIRDVLGAELRERERRGHEITSLDELTTAELGNLWGSVETLLQPRFTAVMDDPELVKGLRTYRDALQVQRAERDEIRATVSS